MKKPPLFFRGLEGTIMIFSLVIILGGTLVLAGWAQMMATRATYATMTEEGQKRRIALANGRALARQYVLNQMPSGNIAYFTTNLTNGWGGFQINGASNLWTNANISVGNPFNPFCDTTFVITNVGHISNSVETYSWTFLIRSRNPLLAGFPLTVQAPASTNLTWASSNSNKIYWDNLMEFSNAPNIPFTSGTTASGTGSTNSYIGFFASPMSTNYTSTDLSPIYPTNTFSTNTAVFSPPAITNGTNTNLITRYFNGGAVAASLTSTQLDTILRYVVPNFITNIFTFTNLVTNMFITTNTSITTNTAVLTTGTNWNAQHTKITGYTYTTNYTYVTNTSTVTNHATNTYVDCYTNSSATNVTIVGSTNTNALHIIVPSSNTNLTSITLSGTNNTRKVYVNHAGGGLILQTATINENYIWWLGMSVYGSGSHFTVLAPTNAKSLTLQGGIRTDRNVDLNQGNIILNPSSSPAISGTNTAPVEIISDRIMWLEEQRTP
ncbi:MAG: hypothetical protein WCO94_01340 [Verrucomicrobiota bacterium]